MQPALVGLFSLLAQGLFLSTMEWHLVRWIFPFWDQICAFRQICSQSSWVVLGKLLQYVILQLHPGLWFAELLQRVVLYLFWVKVTSPRTHRDQVYHEPSHEEGLIYFQFKTYSHDMLPWWNGSQLLSFGIFCIIKPCFEGPRTQITDSYLSSWRLSWHLLFLQDRNTKSATYYSGELAHN